MQPSSILIIGGGAAGLAASDVLRREGYSGPLTMVSADSAPPCDRPNLSKDFLAGTAPGEWIPLRPPEWYSERNIDLVLNSRATSLDTKQKKITIKDGKTYKYGALLLATGADPVELSLEGAARSQILYLRSFADSKAIVAKTKSAKQVVVVGASFIGLEVAASLRARGIVVHVVAPDRMPMEKILGSEVGTFVRGLHESHGVIFHLGETVRHVDGDKVTLTGGQTIEADFIVLGVGVRPSIHLAEQAGLKMDRGIAVDEYLETSARGVFAVGDAARWPYPLTGERIRVEHWWWQSVKDKPLRRICWTCMSVSKLYHFFGVSITTWQSTTWGMRRSGTRSTSMEILKRGIARSGTRGTDAPWQWRLFPAILKVWWPSRKWKGSSRRRGKTV
jgi:NADPH-dependent 2,4-dienoyl-CoA reductase/sulfur reductase-like enzyme